MLCRFSRYSHYLRYSVALVCLLWLAAARADAPQHPNIVLIIIDTLRADRLGAYGYSAPTSPELDSYAQRGVRFERVIAQCTWTRPSIGSLLTSRYPRTLGLRNEKHHALAERFKTLAEILKDHGYATAGATANPNINSDFKFNQGFDHYVDSEILFPMMPGASAQRASGRKLTLASARSLFVEMLDHVRKQHRRPQYLQLTLMDVHEFQALSDHVGERYDALDDAKLSASDVRYLKAIRYTSREIDLFVRSLLRIPGWKNTLIIVTSDHGETLSTDHPSLANPKWHGFLVYETQALVPWIMYSSGGGLPEGLVVERPVRLLDLLPTVLDYAGIPIPERMAGVSLMPLLRAKPKPVPLPEDMVVETRYRGNDKTAVYSDEFIYIENRDGHEGTTPHALHRTAVPADGANTDLAADHAETVTSLRSYLDRWRQRYPTGEPALLETGPSDMTKDQLRALGYLE